jgi:hypothetical protein
MRAPQSVLAGHPCNSRATAGAQLNRNRITPNNAKAALA